MFTTTDRKGIEMYLYWEDTEGSEYRIAKLEKENETYILETYEEELKKAIRKGCIGIGNIDFLQTVYESKELFPFFKNRIPDKQHPYIENILKNYGIEEYDEMKLLKATRGALQTDRYFLKED